MKYLCKVSVASLYDFATQKGPGRTNDTWVLDVAQQKWAAPKLAGCPPSGRSFHSAVALTSAAAAPMAAIFGGLDAKNAHVRRSPPDGAACTWHASPPSAHDAFPHGLRSSTTCTYSTCALGRGRACACATRRRRAAAYIIVWLVSIDSSSIGSAGFCFLFSLPVIEAERFMFDSF